MFRSFVPGLLPTKYDDGAPLSDSAMIDPDSAKDLDELEPFLAEYAAQEDLTATDFWDNWVSLAHRVEKRANAPNANPELRALQSFTGPS